MIEALFNKILYKIFGRITIFTLKIAERQKLITFSLLLL